MGRHRNEVTFLPFVGSNVMLHSIKMNYFLMKHHGTTASAVYYSRDVNGGVLRQLTFRLTRRRRRQQRVCMNSRNNSDAI